MKFTIKIAFFFFLIFIFSCSSIEKSNLQKDISPNVCRINGTIVSIYETKDNSGPCSTYPCTANVLVNDVIGTGFGFKTPLVKMDTIKIKFNFTLQKTSEEIFPNLDKSFPGLAIGDDFIADVERFETIQMNQTNDSYRYIINIYDKLK
jgi:hypothetical protein